MVGEEIGGWVGGSPESVKVGGGGGGGGGGIYNHDQYVSSIVYTFIVYLHERVHMYVSMQNFITAILA